MGPSHDVELIDDIPAVKNVTHEGPNRAQRRATQSSRGQGVRFRYVGGPADGQTGILPSLRRSFKLPAEDEDGNLVAHVYERSKSTRTGVEYRFRDTVTVEKPDES
jgi:hypothetical protein